jgi:anti-sigma B factor antagonist
MITQEQLFVREVREGGVHRLTPIGELDIATAPVLERACSAVMQNAEVEMVVLDLRELIFMDSTGIHLLVRVHAACKDGDRLRVINGSRAVERVLDLSGARDLLPIISSDSDPLAPVDNTAAPGPAASPSPSEGGSGGHAT